MGRYGYKALIGSSSVEDLTFSQVGSGLSQICELSEIPVDKDGRRLKAPPGFFDQASQEILELLQ